MSDNATGLGVRDDVDWESLARQLGTLREDGESGGDKHARDALAAILGDSELIRAVRYYVAWRPGAELVRSVLALLRPRVAALECYRIFCDSEAIEERRAAVELLRVVGDARTLDWLGEFIDDPDSVIRCWGAGLLKQLVWSDCIDAEEAERWIAVIEAKATDELRDAVAEIREALRRMQGSD